MSYSTSNLARKLEAKPEAPVRRRRVKKRSSILNFKTLFAIVIGFSVLMFIQWREGQIYKLRRDILDQQQRLFRLEAQNRQSQLELDKMLNLDNVEKVASTKLNMHKPAKNQVVYLNVPKPDVGEVVKKQKSTNTGFFAALVHGVGSIVEYLQ